MTVVFSSGTNLITSICATILHNTTRQWAWCARDSVLDHYLRSVTAGDTPAGLNMKTYAGAVVLYHRFFQLILETMFPIRDLTIAANVLYQRAHWILYQRLMTAYHLPRSSVNRHLHEKTIVEYREQTDDAAVERL